jgi:hypothetical protein
MTLATWENRHTITDKEPAMARKLIFRLNVGLDDQATYGIPNGPSSQEPPHEGDIMTVDDEKLANVLVSVIKVAEDYDPKKEAEREEKIRKFDEQNIAQFEASQRVQSRASKQFNTLERPRDEFDEAADRARADAKAKADAEEAERVAKSDAKAKAVK